MTISTALRFIGAIIIAVATAFALLIAVELFSAIVYPFPSDFKGTEEEMCRHVARYPGWVLAAVVPMWGFTALVSTWVAGRIGNRASAMIVSVLLLTAVICNVSMLPYPVWFKLLMPIVVFAAAVYGITSSTRRRAINVFN